MAEETKTTPKPTDQDGDVVEQTPATDTDQDQGERDAESREPDYKRMYLDAKSKVEEANRLKERIAELESRTEPMPAVPSADRSRLEKLNDLLIQAASFRDKGDPIAALALEQRAEILQLKQDMFDLRALDKIPDEGKQKKVLQHYEGNRHRLGDIKAARAEIDAADLLEENRILREKYDALNKRPDPEVVNAPPTHGREIPATIKGKQMSGEEFDHQAARIKQEQGELAELKFRSANASRVKAG